MSRPRPGSGHRLVAAGNAARARAATPRSAGACRWPAPSPGPPLAQRDYGNKLFPCPAGADTGPLQRFDLLADRLPGDVQVARRPRETAPLRHRGEGAQLAELETRAGQHARDPTSRSRLAATSCACYRTTACRDSPVMLALGLGEAPG